MRGSSQFQADAEGEASRRLWRRNVRSPLRHLWPGVLALALPILSGMTVAPAGRGPAIAISLVLSGVLGLALYGSPRRS
jgi:hypothetical protein